MIGQGRKIKYSIKDTYSFVNLTDKIPEKIYTKKFGQLLGRALRTIHDGTAGQCYGMAATVAASAEYNSPAASSYVDESNKKVENLFDVKPDMKSLHQYKHFLLPCCIAYLIDSQKTTFAIKHQALFVLKTHT